MEYKIHFESVDLNIMMWIWLLFLHVPPSIKF